MSSIKKICEFSVNKEVIVDEEQVSKDASGNDVKTITKVKKTIPIQFYLKKPNRSLRDRAELYHYVSFSDGVRAGLLTYPLLEKRYSNDGGILSETQKQRYLKLYSELYDLENKYQRLVAKGEKTDEEKAELKTTIEGIALIQRDLRMFELDTQTLFNSTAESRAKKQTTIWYVLNLSYYGDDKPFFGEGDEKERLLKFDQIEDEDDEFLNKVKARFVYLVSIWFDNNNLTVEDCKMLLKAFDEDEKALAIQKEAREKELREKEPDKT